MSKKYVINIFESAQMVEQIGVNDKGEAVVCSTLVDNLEELNSDYINEHFGELQDTAYQKGFEDGKAVNDKRCEGCKYEGDSKFEAPCCLCSSNFENRWTAKQTDDNIDIIRNGIHNWVTQLNIGLEDISKILEDMRHD